MDHRRAPSEAVLDAVVAVIAEHGLEGTSVRRVASRAGLSIGAVQHHFPTKDAMLAAAMARVEEVFRRRLEEQTAGLPDEPAARLRAAVRSLVPVTSQERWETAVWLAFVARAAVHEATAAQHRATWERAEEGLAWLVTGSAEAPPGPDAAASAGPPAWAREAAAGLLALVDGLAVAALVEPGRVPPERAHRLADDAVDRVLEHAARRDGRTAPGRPG